jgi:sporulation protein YlmC with PRC-barrel domain
MSAGETPRKRAASGTSVATADEFQIFFTELTMTTFGPQGNFAGAVQNSGDGAIGDGPGPEIMAASSLDGNKVMSSDGEHVGRITNIMLDVRTGRVGYAVLSKRGFLGLGSTRHAIPWSALTLDTSENCFRVNITARQIREEPGIDKDHWPSMAGITWASELHRYYNRDPYWSSAIDSSESKVDAAVEEATTS